MLAFIAAEESIEDDVLNAEKTGSNQKETSIQKRLETHEKMFLPHQRKQVKHYVSLFQKSQTKISKQQSD